MKMNFIFNINRIRGGGKRGQREQSPMVVICITRGKAGIERGGARRTRVCQTDTRMDVGRQL